MLSGLVNIFKIPDLKRRILITSGLLIVYRIGCYVPTPGVNGAALSQFFQQIHIQSINQTLLIRIELHVVRDDHGFDDDFFERYGADTQVIHFTQIVYLIKAVVAGCDHDFGAGLPDLFGL